VEGASKVHGDAVHAEAVGDAGANVTFFWGELRSALHTLCQASDFIELAAMRLARREAFAGDVGAGNAVAATGDLRRHAAGHIQQGLGEPRIQAAYSCTTRLWNPRWVRPLCRSFDPFEVVAGPNFLTLELRCATRILGQFSGVANGEMVAGLARRASTRANQLPPRHLKFACSLKVSTIVLRVLRIFINRK
jgi:hypothetical protein